MQQDNQHLNTPAPQPAISDDQVTSYLRSHPHFFEHHASLLTEIYLPSPHGAGAISLAERQQLAQRDKIRVLEVKLASLIGYAQENDATSEKIHVLCVNLLKNQGFENLQSLIANSMQNDFAVTQSAIRIWANPTNSVASPPAEFSPENKVFIEWVQALNAPHCGALPDAAKGMLNDELASFAFIPLYQNRTDERQAFGVLMLGAADAERFKADMGLMYLERIGELISASVLPYIK